MMLLDKQEECEKMAEALKKEHGAELILSIQQGMDDVKQGKVQPIESLWDALDD